jgi:alkylhydroperoxidase family enzyme
VGVEALAPGPNADPKPVRKLAHGAELTAAVAGGADALQALAGRYPSDANVHKALVLAHSSRSAGIADAVAAIRRLLAVAPERNADEDVRYILKRAAGLDGKPAQAAFEVMTGHMGSAGPDLIWELLRKSELSDRAAAELSKPVARAHFSQPLAIAYELRFAPSCKARLGLLGRAERVGDQRSINVLSALVSKPRRCRKQTGRRCRVRCEQQAERFAASIEVIAARLRKLERERGT